MLIEGVLVFSLLHSNTLSFQIIRYHHFVMRLIQMLKGTLCVRQNGSIWRPGKKNGLSCRSDVSICHHVSFLWRQVTYKSHASCTLRFILHLFAAHFFPPYPSIKKNLNTMPKLYFELLVLPLKFCKLRMCIKMGGWKRTYRHLNTFQINVMQ